MTRQGEGNMSKYIEHEVGDDLHQQRWQYWFNDREMCLKLNSYSVLTRPSKRHKMREVTWWGSARHWGGRDKEMKREDVPTPDEVKAAVLEKFRAMITIEE
jgi:hypothetical protein